mgnify:CR=1 FL=1
MRLYEFAGKDPIVTKLVVLSDQLKSAVGSGEIQGEWTTDDLIEFLAKNDIMLEKPTIYDVVKKSPLNSVLRIDSNTDKVTFNKNDGVVDANPDPNASQQVVKQMAQKAMK